MRAMPYIRPAREPPTYFVINKKFCGEVVKSHNTLAVFFMLTVIKNVVFRRTMCGNAEVFSQWNCTTWLQVQSDPCKNSTEELG